MKQQWIRKLALCMVAVFLLQSPLTIIGANEKEAVLRERVSQENVTTALERAEDYLKSHVTNPVVNPMNGEWSVLSMARYGNLLDSTKKAYLSNLYATLEETKGVLSDSKYTEYSRVILALTAMGISPSNVNGYNLLYNLSDYESVIYQGINGAIFALIAYDSHQYEIVSLTEEDKENGMVQTTRELLIDTILKSELNGGGWTLQGKQPEVDITAMAIQSLVPYYDTREDVKQAVNRAVEWLSSIQNSQGGFSLLNQDNLESIAQVVIALSTLDYQLLTDVAMNQGTEVESQQSVDEITGKVIALPQQVTIKHSEEVYSLLVQLNEMGYFASKETLRNQLNIKIEEIKKQTEEVEQLDSSIWNQINPLNVSLEDKEKVILLMNQYNSLLEDNKTYVENAQDLLDASAIIDKLQRQIIPKEKNCK